MPEVTAVPVTSTTTNTAPVQNTEAATPDAKEPKAASSQPDPKEFWKKAVAGRTFKHKGIEKKLEELDPEEAFEHLRRGFGASELAAEAKKTKAQAEEVLALRQRLFEGSDDEALDALVQFGGERGLKLLDSLRARLSQEQEATSKMTEAERQHFEARQRAEAELQQYRAAEAKRQEEETKKQEQATAAQVKQEALSKAASLAKALKGFPPGKVDALGPYVARAWKESIDLGMELGRDVSPDALMKRAEELFKASTSDFYGGLSTEEQFDFLGETSVRKLSALLVKRLRGGPAAPVMKPADGAPRAPQQKQGAPKLGDPGYFR